MWRLRCGAVSSLFAVVCVSSSALDLTTNGASSYVILGDGSDPAVQDLQHYIEVMSGASLSILPLATDPIPGQAIVVGDRTIPGYTPPALGPHGFHLFVLGNQMIVHGGSVEGTQFGVYGLLEDHLGCRWLTRDFESIPNVPTIQVSDTLNEVQEPSIRDRYRIGQGSYSYADADWRRRNRVGVLMKGQTNHNMYQWLPPSVYFDAHPDWYPLSADGGTDHK